MYKTYLEFRMDLAPQEMMSAQIGKEKRKKERKIFYTIPQRHSKDCLTVALMDVQTLKGSLQRFPRPPAYTRSFFDNSNISIWTFAEWKKKWKSVPNPDKYVMGTIPFSSFNLPLRIALLLLIRLLSNHMSTFEKAITSSQSCWS